MDLISEENYIIAQAKKAHETDPYAAKAWIMTAKTLYPNNFHVQFEAYKIEKVAKNYEEAAKCFSYIILTFQNQNQPMELWNEISELTAALRAPENETTPYQEFFVKMFQHVSYDVQHKILLLIANHTDNSMDHCRLLLLLLKRFPIHSIHAVVTHSPRLIEIITQGMDVAPEQFQKILVHEALPLIYNKTPELPSPLVCAIYTIALEYYIKQILAENPDNKSAVHDVWREIFQLISLCGKILNWDNFLPFNKSWSKDVYWQRLVQIVAADPSRTSENKQILFYATTLFIYSLQEYISNTKIRTDDGDLEFALVEGFREISNDFTSNLRPRDNTMEQPKISITSPPCSRETPVAFVTAANCWHLLNSNEQFQREFSQLLIKLPLSQWISRFLFDLAIYFGHHEEAKKLLNDMQITSIQQNIRILCLILMQGPLTIQGFDCILKILVELPSIPGKLIDMMTCSSLITQRHLILLPLTQKAIIQYCTRAIIGTLSRKVYEPNCNDLIFGDLLVLTQLEYPKENNLVEHIFALIKSKGQFSYLLFPQYIINIDYIEEFMNIWYTHNGDFNLEFISSQTNLSGQRRIGTRGADKGVREDFKQIIKQQVIRSNDDIPALIAQFITQEHSNLIQNIF